MGQTNSFTRLINSRKHIRLYAREYAEEHGLNASEVEKDIIQAKKYNHISFGEYAWTDTGTEEDGIYTLVPYGIS